MNCLKCNIPLDLNPSKYILTILLKLNKKPKHKLSKIPHMYSKTSFCVTKKIKAHFIQYFKNQLMKNQNNYSRTCVTHDNSTITKTQFKMSNVFRFTSVLLHIFMESNHNYINNCFIIIETPFCCQIAQN